MRLATGRRRREFVLITGTTNKAPRSSILRGNGLIRADVPGMPPVAITARCTLPAIAANPPTA